MVVDCVVVVIVVYVEDCVGGDGCGVVDDDVVGEFGGGCVGEIG